ncbi:outer membrane lipoprotein carrier protein LolA [Geopsychrobacter electrodiphilus]|uniref:outer membrane lipoprotein carrier protein LolA n=1 Tax=Geopsychrobacter electrodiphilus TaxID=225196 RepID=UPI000683FC7E|nr:outer membrane lipoprotein carrier protein LolA [Geopsychrobacter electrodiphilus]
MRKLCCLNLLLVVLFLVAAPLGAAETTDLHTLLRQLQDTAGQTHSLKSDFIQEKELAIFSEKLVSAGRFAYQQPDRLRWELLTPIDSGFVLRGDKGERWNSLSRERSDFSVANDPIMGIIARQLLAWARVDLDWLQSRYRMELLAESPVRLRLTPLDKGEAGFIEELQILFAGDRSHVAEVLLKEQGGDSTLLRFTNVQLNTALPVATFEAPEFK